MFLFAHFSHHAMIGVITPLLPWLRDAFGLDYSRSGMLVSALSLSYGLAQLPMSSLGDRWSKTSLIGLGLLGVSIAGLAVSFSSGFYMLLASIIVMGLFGATYHAPTSSFLSQWFSQEQRGRALGTHAIGGSASLIVTPVAAVLIAGFTGDWRYSFAALSIPALVAGVSIALVGRQWDRASLAKMASASRERVNLVEIARLVGVLLAVALLSQMAIMGINAFLPLYLVDNHHVPRETAGMLVGLAAGAGIFGAPLGGILSDRFGRKPVIVLSVAMIGPAILLLTVVPFGPAMLGTIAVYGLFWTMRMPVIESLIADTVPWHRRATVLGLYFFISQESTGISTPVVGWFIDIYGLQPVFTGLALVCLACPLLLLLFKKRI